MYLCVSYDGRNLEMAVHWPLYSEQLAQVEAGVSTLVQSCFSGTYSQGSSPVCS